MANGYGKWLMEGWVSPIIHDHQPSTISRQP
jgi:hypothetical protein